jgi:hypothetical protein
MRFATLSTASASAASLLVLSAVLSQSRPVAADAPNNLKAEGQVVMVGMLTPAVQKACLAADHGHELPPALNDLKVDERGEAILIGLLLPAVQKAPDAAVAIRPDVLIEIADRTMFKGEIVGIDALGICVQTEGGRLMFIIL